MRFLQIPKVSPIAWKILSSKPGRKPTGISNWIYELSKKEAAGLGLRLNPKTEIIEDEREPMPFRIKFTESPDPGRRDR